MQNTLFLQKGTESFGRGDYLDMFRTSPEDSSNSCQDFTPESEDKFKKDGRGLLIPS